MSHEREPIPVLLNQAALAVTTSTFSEPKIQPLRFVVASIVSPSLNLEAYDRFAEYLGKRLHRPVEIVRRRTYLELNELLLRGVAQAGLICPGAYVIGREDFGLRAVVIPVIDGTNTYQAYLIVRKDSRFKSLADLRGASFAFSDPLSNTGYLYVAERLVSQGTRVDQFFGSVSFTYSHDNTIQAVRDGIADAGLANSLIWAILQRDTPEVTRDLEVIEKSPMYPNNPIVISPNSPASLQTQLTEVLLSMSTEMAGLRVLRKMGISKFVPATESDFDPINENWHKIGRLHGK